MKQFKLALFLTILMSMFGLEAFALIEVQQLNSDGVTIYYVINDEETAAAVKTTGDLYDDIAVSSYSGNIKIPSSISYMGKTFPVTSIREKAFREASGLISVSIPNSVTNIGDGAFRGSGLTTLTIPSSVTSIGNDIVIGCENLTSIVIDANNTTYDSRNNCNAIIESKTNQLIAGCKTTTIANSVTSIGEYAFAGITSITSLSIPASVNSIGKGAFSGCIGLTSVSFPSSVTSIGSEAFTGCTNLATIEIPSSVTSIGFDAFGGTAWLDNFTSPGIIYAGNVLYKFNGQMLSNTNLDIEAGTVGIAGGAFYNCKGLKTLTIPSSVKCIEEGAFDACRNLTTVTIQDGLEKIGKTAFFNCNSLTSVNIPSSVKSIGGGAFIYCNPQLKINISDLSAWCNIQFEDAIMNRTTFVCYWDDFRYPDEGEDVVNNAALCLNGSDITDLTIPSGITSICAYTFAGIGSITSVTIPNSVTSIGKFAFDCQNLTKVVSLITNPFDIAEDDYGNYCAFGWDYNPIYSQGTLYVPTGTITLYQAKNGWNLFSNIQEGTGGGNNPTPSPSGNKCAKPIISFIDGKLSFSCATDGVNFMYNITNDDVMSGYGNDLMLGMTYHISVYATKDGFDNSDAATMDITINGNGKAVVVGDMDNNGVLNAVDVVKLVDKVMGRQ